MMQKKNHWETVYRHKDPLEVSWYQQEPTHSLNLINTCGIDKDSAIIDIGGGASQLVDHLYAQGYDQLTVLDISSHALRHAQDRLGQDASSRITWLEMDITHFSPPRHYALWHDRAVFHFLTEAEERARYRTALNEALPPGGHLILAAFAPDGPTQCSGLDIVQYDESKITQTLGQGFQLLDSSHEMHTTPAQKTQSFNYFHFIRTGMDE